MFKLNTDEKLSMWASFRKELDTIDNPYDAVSEFWSTAPLIMFNHNIDRFNIKSWPTPWEIICENKYDDFTLAIMIAHTIKLTKKFNKDILEIRTMVDSDKTKLYNLVYVNDTIVLNYNRFNAINVGDIDQTLYLENIIDINYPR
jgi:hypothetical protein